MISIIIERIGNDVRALYMSGHSGYSEQGTDIICSSASTLFYTAANALEELCSLKAEDIITVNEDKGDGNVNAVIKVPELTGDAKVKAQTIMETIEVGFKCLEMSVNTDEDQYIELIESKN